MPNDPGDRLSRIETKLDQVEQRSRYMLILLVVFLVIAIAAIFI